MELVWIDYANSYWTCSNGHEYDYLEITGNPNDYICSGDPPMDPIDFDPGADVPYPKGDYPHHQRTSILNETTAGGIHFYEGIKIRKLLAKITQTKGYPVIWGAHMEFVAGMSIWIPVGHVVKEKQTIFYESKGDLDKWRHVIIKKVSTTFLGIDFGEILSKLPFIGEYFDVQTWKQPLKMWDVFENFGFYNTMHDMIIKANWDKIRDMLEWEGY